MRKCTNKSKDTVQRQEHCNEAVGTETEGEEKKEQKNIPSTGIEPVSVR